jgi:hypothetical protein
LESALAQRNGFVAFENSLLVLPTERNGDLPGLVEWNDIQGWRRYYETVPFECVFFGMDVFACQFAISGDGIVRFDPESGTIDYHSKSLNAWAQKVLDNYDYETGWSVAKAWQEKNGPLPMGCRLLGRVPFILGGEYSPDNLVCVTLDVAMSKLTGLYSQLKNTPDGTTVTIRGWV